MTRNELYTILLRCGPESTPIHTLNKIWGQPFEGETEKITKKDEGEDHATTKRRLKMAHEAIRLAVDAFETVNMWEEGECASTELHECLKDFLPIPEQANTTKSASSTSPATEDSSATLSEPLPNGTTYTRSYQVFLPNPNQPNP